LPIGLLIQVYLTGSFIAMVNNIRTLGAHRFINDGRELTFVEQLLDSVNYPKFSIIAEMWGPVGLRYHALHHLFPSLPYHNLGRAHQRLMAELPADSPYRQTNSDSLRQSLLRLWRASLASSRRRKAGEISSASSQSTKPEAPSSVGKSARPKRRSKSRNVR
jgi:fatty acid desaturase